MHMQQAYGTWNSPITATMVTTAGVRLGDIAFQAGAAFWAEARPEDNGRSTIVKARPNQAPCDLTLAPYNPRTRVHEYGGGSWWVDDKYLYFVHWDDQRLYRVDHVSSQNNTPLPITAQPDVAQALRYADGCVSSDGQWIVCVRESHDATTPQPRNEIIAIRNVVSTGTADQSASNTISVLATGADFYSTPRLSPDGQRLSWVQWSHPQMPWDGTELMVANVQSDMSLQNSNKISGNSEISVMGAMWTRAGELVYASDESGWWNLYQYSTDTQSVQQLTRFTDREVGAPAWIFGIQRFVELVGSDSENDSNNASTEPSVDTFTKARSVCLALAVTHSARDQLQVLHADGHTSTIETPYTSISHIAADESGHVLVQGQAEDQQTSISLIDCHQPIASKQAQQTE